MDDDFDIRILEEMMSQIRGLANHRAISVTDIVHEAIGEYLYNRATGINFIDVIRGIENAFSGLEQFVTSADPSGLALFIKSPIRYVHRPELKYEVRTIQGGGDSVGILNVILRSQSMETLRVFADFTGMWMELEQKYLARGRQISHMADIGYYNRRIYRPEAAARVGEQQIGEAIGNYINVFDELLKHSFHRRLSGQELERIYLARLKAGMLTI